MGGDAIYFILLAVQFGMQPILNNAFVPRGVANSALIAITELLKIVFSFALLIWSGAGCKQVFAVPFEALRDASIPASLYAVQNWLILSSLKYISPLSMSLLNQTKTLSAAFFSYTLLGKRQTMWQVFALFGLMFGASLIITAESKPTTATASSDMFPLGVAFVGSASVLSGISSAYTEIALAQSKARSGNSHSGLASSLVFSIELAVVSLAVLGASLALGFNPDSAKMGQSVLALTPASFIPLVSNASGGILVGMVTQKFGGVQKGFALILGICLSAAFEAVFGGKEFTLLHLTAVLVVCASMWLYFTHPPPPQDTRDKMKKM